ncbi:Ribosomal protein L6, subgroup [Desulfovibrio sp. X2]|uniref:50S ribosomal protein L6 n=1 Tax=Desulfovibrio sp. X2 TaxID=941449 RepID=UPI000358720A|nr:50S ribosomal protein L6 [Desulfovibrio sp. X2]EPR42635.1 Ribosomal protein L6, subgroup [Desulfovibrio sp. X2]
MSRIGKKHIELPSGVEVKVGDEVVEVKGPKGALTTPRHAKVAYAVEGNQVNITRVDESRAAREQHGLRRTLLANCVEGVTKGYQKELEVVGVGYKLQVQGKSVVLSVGYSHPVNFPLPAGIEAKAEGNKLTIMGIDKQLVGEVAAQIRRVRPPEPFKGKGIKYANEHIRRKAGKSGGKK